MKSQSKMMQTFSFFQVYIVISGYIFFFEKSVVLFGSQLYVSWKFGVGSVVICRAFFLRVFYEKKIL